MSSIAMATEWIHQKKYEKIDQIMSQAKKLAQSYVDAQILAESDIQFLLDDYRTYVSEGGEESFVELMRKVSKESLKIRVAKNDQRKEAHNRDLEKDCNIVADVLVSFVQTKCLEDEDFYKDVRYIFCVDVACNITSGTNMSAVMARECIKKNKKPEMPESRVNEEILTKAALIFSEKYQHSSERLIKYAAGHLLRAALFFDPQNKELKVGLEEYHRFYGKSKIMKQLDELVPEPFKRGKRRRKAKKQTLETED